MSTPIGNNTEELREILQTVNALPSAESGGGGSGGSSGIPVIDLRELGFPEITGSEYFNGVEIDQAAYNTLKTKLEAGFVKITVGLMGGAMTLGLATNIVDMPDFTEYAAFGPDSTNMWYRFEIFNDGGSYGANLILGE